MSGYIGSQPVPQATQHREAFTATASQTSFATVGYTPQFVDVYLNGVKLAAADYTATNGSDIVLTTGAALNDILEYVAYTPFEVADQTFTGTTTLTDSGAAPLVANRTTSDGDIIDLQKDGTTVGSIGTTSDNSRFRILDGSNRGFAVRTDGGETALEPSTTTAQNGYGSLGTSGARWKDLYLSGGVYLGGVGAANKLDDYEEGTWTPTISVGTITSEGTVYTKIGSTVTLSGLVTTFSDITTASNVEIGGLPFTPQSDTTGSMFGRYTGNTNLNASFVSAASSNITFNGVTTLDFDPLQHADLTNSTVSAIYFSATYKTA